MELLLIDQKAYNKGLKGVVVKWQHDSLQNCYAGVRFPSTPPVEFTLFKWKFYLGGEASELLQMRGKSKAGVQHFSRKVLDEAGSRPSKARVVTDSPLRLQ